MPKHARPIHQGSYKSKAERRQLAQSHNQLAKQQGAATLLLQSHPQTLNLPVWLVLIMLFGSATSTNEFPIDGTYSEQKGYIDSLTGHCTEPAVIDVLDRARALPLAVDDIAPGVKYEVWKHSLFRDDNTAVRRHITMTRGKTTGGMEKNRQDTTEITIGSEGNNGAVLHKFKLNANGDWTPNGKERKSMEEHTKDMRKSDEFIVRASKEDVPGVCYNRP